jgi:hypothetical protein
MTARLLLSLGVLAPFTLLACSGGTSSDGGGHDARSSDASNGSDAGSADGSASDGAPGSGVTAIYYKNGTPAAGATVVFSDPSGALLQMATTDSNGSASFAVPAMGMVTVADMSTGSLSTIQTIAGVQPNDQLLFGGRRPPSTLTGNIKVSYPNVFPGAQYVDVDLGCQVAQDHQPTQALTIPVTSSCLDHNSLLTVVSTARKSDGTALAYALDTDITIPAGGTATLAVSMWKTDFVDYTMIASDVPTGGTLFVASIGLSRSGSPAFGSASQTKAIMAGTLLQDVVPMPPAFGDKMNWSARVFFGGFTGPASEVALYNTAPTATITVDLGTTLLGQITRATLDASMPQRPALTWDSAASSGNLTGASLRVQWSVNGTMGTWEALHPPAASGSFQFPEMPADIAAKLPTSAANYVGNRVEITDVSGFPTYDEYRTQVGYAGTAMVIPPDNTRLRSSYRVGQ